MAKKKAWIIVTMVLMGYILIVTGLMILTSEPFFCKSCHVMRRPYETWKNSPHSRVSCYDCHGELGALGFLEEKIEELRMILLFPTKSYQRPISSTVKNDGCIHCHREILQKIVVKSAIRISHDDCIPQGGKCTDCHNTVAHGKALTKENNPTMDKCTQCHGKKATKDCLKCHVKGERKRHAGPWAVTHGTTWEKTHGMGDTSTCIICHEKEDCERCHSLMPHQINWPHIHGKKFKKDDKNCLTCHIQSFCDNCHQMEMPHPEGFLKKHSKEFKRLGRGKCLRCHVKKTCGYCHIKHVHPGVVMPKVTAP
ncbi:MAG: NapC/NirT family cytochrome c [Actinomycetota bacterium]|nr:NapC/NirT family cytochrome c [Actinomycetota bacterium]